MTWGKIIVPGAVWQETVGMHRITHATLDELKNIKVIHVSRNDLHTFVQRFDLEKLHSGETEGLYLCKQHDIPLFLTDDLAARKAAKSLGLQPVGSVGIILRAWKSDKLSLQEAEQSLKALQQASTLFVTPEIIEIAIRQLQ
jgi:predicted nucleic acid-binding protein